MPRNVETPNRRQPKPQAQPHVLGLRHFDDLLRDHVAAGHVELGDLVDGPVCAQCGQGILLHWLRCEACGSTEFTKPEPPAPLRERDVCKSCLNVALEQGVTDPTNQQWLMKELGSLVEEHPCQKRDDQHRPIICRCGCNS